MKIFLVRWRARQGRFLEEFTNVVFERSAAAARSLVVKSYKGFNWKRVISVRKLTPSGPARIEAMIQHNLGVSMDL